MLEANPDFRGFVWDFQPTDDPWDKALLKTMSGKRMPQIGRVEISIIEEDQSRWLAFHQKELDYLAFPRRSRPQVFDGDKLKPELDRQGHPLYRVDRPGPHLHELQLPRPGRRRLRQGEDRAAPRDHRWPTTSMSRSRWSARVRRCRCRCPFPPGVVGHDPRYRSINQYDPDAANKLLDYFGYKKGADGWRTLPDGKPLLIQLASQTEQFRAAS